MRAIVQFIREHPIWSAFVSFLVVGLPQWVQAIWGLFYSEPLAPIFVAKLTAISMPTFEVEWITAPFGLSMLLAIWWQVRRWHPKPLTKAHAAGPGAIRAQATPERERRLRDKQDLSSKELRTQSVISMAEAATQLYGALDDIPGDLLRDGAEKLGGPEMSPASPNERLDYVATFISGKMTVSGRKSPDRNVKEIDEADIQRSSFGEGATILRDNTYDKSIYWVDLCVRTHEFDALMAALLEGGRAEKEGCDLGFLKVTAHKSRASALLYLTALRGEGVRIRNEGKSVEDATISDWQVSAFTWMRETIAGVGFVDAADSVWFATLGDVPITPSIPILSRCDRATNKDAHMKSYREHAERLARLDRLLAKYGVGA